MEWKTIRRWLILMVLAVDLFLAGNLLRQGLSVLHNERQAVQDAVAVAQTRGVDISAEAVLRLPTDMTLWQASRSEELENTAALALLGPVQREAPGGGVAIYTADKGQMVFRRGGAVELNGLWDQPLDAASCTAALESAGFAAATAVQRLVHRLAKLSGIGCFTDDANCVTRLIGAGTHDRRLRFFRDGICQFPHLSGI